MNRKAEDLETDEFDAPPAEGGASNYGDQERKKKKSKTAKTRAWKGKDKKEKAGRRARRRDDGVPAAEGEDHEAGEPKAPRLPKRQCALLIGFCGTGYSGMQFQPDVPRTIEGVLFDALVKAGAVSQDNADDPVKVNLARAARTDAGVHAAGNIVSIKAITSIPDFVARINGLLPPEIRLWGFVRAQNSFNARIACDSRKYTYYFPSYILLPPKPGSGFDQASKHHGYGSDDSPLHTDVLLDNEFWKGHESSSKEEDLARKRAWRVNPSQVARLREIVSKFEGTHNFHNFTVGREFKDRSNQRHMKKIEVVDPVVYGDTEWISVLFHGQSFMLHQQRKMMTALVMTYRTGAPSDIIDELYSPRIVLVPKMPSLGLLLEEPVFESYNGRMAIINDKLDPSDPAYRPPIDFDLYRDQIVEFKDDFIYKNMREVEDQTGLFDAWIRMVDTYAGNDLLYFNPNGSIPEAAVIEKGVRRDNPFREKRKFNMTGFAATTEDKSEEKLQEDEDEDDEGSIDKQELAEKEDNIF
ncbi:Pseudouridine synthase [Amanita muscaria]